MSIRDKPYLPLYVQDFLTDEKLIECSAAATGIYIRIMCIMHKSEPYGKILLKQKDKQNTKPSQDFALKLAKHLPWGVVEVEVGILELLEAGCLQIEGDFLVQKRMVEDGELSVRRSETGRSGGLATQKMRRDFAKAKLEANTDSDIDSRIYDIICSSLNGSPKETTNYLVMVIVEMMKVWMQHKPDYTTHEETDYHALLELAYYIAEKKGWKRHDILELKEYEVVASWEKWAMFLSHPETDKFFRGLTLDGVAIKKNTQKIVEAMKQSRSAIEDKQKQKEKSRIKPEDYFTE